MLDAILTSAPPPARQRVPAAVCEPNYAALVEVLTRLWQIPDGLGETVLRPEEAAAIRACGFGARAGCVWRCPLLPDALVSWNPLLRHLSDAVDPLSRPGAWKPKRAPSRLASQRDPLARVERLILTHLSKEPYYMTKRQLQQRMWRYPARFFNRTLARMIQNDRVTVYEGFLFPYGHEDFAYVLNECRKAKCAPKQPRYTL
jgi:hypothetical protein